MMSSEGFNVHEAWEEIGVDPHDPNAMLKVLVRQKRELATMAGRVADLESYFGQTRGQSADPKDTLRPSQQI